MVLGRTGDLHKSPGKDRGASQGSWRGPSLHKTFLRDGNFLSDITQRKNSVQRTELQEGPGKGKGPFQKSWKGPYLSKTFSRGRGEVIG